AADGGSPRAARPPQTTHRRRFRSRPRRSACAPGANTSTSSRPRPEGATPNADEPANLVERLKEGNPRAPELLFRRYAVRLARLAEQHLSRKVAVRVDGEDVVQSVFRTFFRRCASGEFTVDGSGRLWRLLVTITLNKVRAGVRYHTAARRDVAAEAPS